MRARFLAGLLAAGAGGLAPLVVRHVGEQPRAQDGDIHAQLVAVYQELNAIRAMLHSLRRGESVGAVMIPEAWVDGSLSDRVIEHVKRTVYGVGDTRASALRELLGTRNPFEMTADDWSPAWGIGDSLKQDVYNAVANFRDQVMDDSLRLLLVEARLNRLASSSAADTDAIVMLAQTITEHAPALLASSIATAETTSHDQGSASAGSHAHTSEAHSPAKETNAPDAEIVLSNLWEVFGLSLQLLAMGTTCLLLVTSCCRGITYCLSASC